MHNCFRFGDVNVGHILENLVVDGRIYEMEPKNSRWEDVVWIYVIQERGD
jgi:hypothetical protein